MRTISIYDLRNNLADWLNEVTANDSRLLVSRFGKPIAIISPYSDTDVVNFDRFYNVLGKGETGDKLVNRIRRSNKEKERTKTLRS